MPFDQSWSEEHLVKNMQGPPHWKEFTIFRKTERPLSIDMHGVKRDLKHVVESAKAYCNILPRNSMDIWRLFVF